MTQDNAAYKTQVDQIYKPQEQWINNQLTALPTYYNAQKASMEQAKVNAFRDIGNTAQGRGMFFSGFQPHEQARYLGEKYLPGLMEIDNQMNREKTGLLGQMANVQVGKGEKMLGYADKWDDRNWDVAQSDKDFQRQKELSEWEAQLSLKYAPRSSSSGGSRSGGGSSSKSKFDPSITSQIDGVLSSVTGSDGKVSPSDYNQAKSLWYSKGGDIADFNAIFAPRYAHGATSPIQQYIGG